MTIVILLTLVGCWDKNEIDDMAYVISIGLDKGIQNKVKLSVLIAIPAKLVEGGGSSGSSNGKESAEKGKGSSEVVSVESPTIPAGLNMINAFISRQLSLSHLKAIIFSKELSMEGIGDYLSFFDRSTNIRPVTTVIVSRESAYDFLMSLKPVLEINPSKFIELTAKANKITAFIPNATIGDFIKEIKSFDEQPYAVLGGINKQAVEEEGKSIPFKEPFRKDSESDVPNEGEYLAGNIPRIGDVERELMGTAIFDGDKMVGEFNGIETAAMGILRGEFERNFWSFKDPIKKGLFVPIDVRQKKHPTIKVKRQENNIKINVKLHLEGYLIAVQSEVPYEKEEYMVILEKSIEEVITHLSEKVIIIAQKDFKSDVFKFGNYVRRTYWLQDEWEKANWKAAFQNATIKVETDFFISRSGILYKDSPYVSSQGVKK